MVDIGSLNGNAPTHSVRHYRSWRLRCDADQPSDMLWISGGCDNAAPHRFLPFVEPSLILRLALDPATGRRIGCALLIGSSLYDAGWHQPRAGQLLIGLRLPPELCGPAFALSPRDYRDMEPVPAPLSFQHAFADTLRLAERAPVETIAHAFHHRLGEIAADRPRRKVHRAIALMRADDGKRSCHMLADQLGLSERQLRRLFIDEVGIAPKAYAKRLRLTAAMIRAERYEEESWAETALAAGYADQAHLIRDCRALMGASPEKVRRQRSGDGRFVQ